MKCTSTGPVTACLAMMLAFPAPAQSAKTGDDIVDNWPDGD